MEPRRFDDLLTKLRLYTRHSSMNQQYDMFLLVDNVELVMPSYFVEYMVCNLSLVRRFCDLLITLKLHNQHSPTNQIIWPASCWWSRVHDDFVTLASIKAFPSFRSKKRTFFTNLAVKNMMGIKINIQTTIKLGNTQKRDTYTQLLESKNF